MDKINGELSRGARWTLGSFTILLAIGFTYMGKDMDVERAGYFGIFYYSFCAFLYAIPIACVTTGRLRKFVGSCIGVYLFFLSILLIYYAVVIEPSQIMEQSEQAEQPGKGAILFMVFLGLPSLAYAFMAKFGLGNDSDDQL